MSFLLADLLDGSTDRGKLDTIRVTGVHADSRALAMGDAFFALPGFVQHGDTFAAKAVERGARVMITDRRPAADPGIPVVVVDDVRRAFALAAMRTSGPQPSTMFGITGTNGKTSIASFVRQIWDYMGLASASIGTLGVQFRDQIEPGTHTTPDPLSLHRRLAALKADGIDHVIMEASSHGIVQRRIDGVAFDVVGFTNLTRDHLDYHPTMEDYRDAKLRLFTTLLKEGGSAVINADDPEHLPFMFAALERGATVMTVGREGAYIEVTSVEQDGWGQKVSGKLVGEPLEFTLPLAGDFQVSNAIVAAAMVMAGGAHRDNVIPALQTLRGARGRLERVGTKDGAAIFIDYAHTPDALGVALNTLRPYASGKLKVVFGAGGDRDKGKRPLMGRIAAERADEVIVTDDNPRTEDAAAIRREILAASENAVEIGDRAEAIRSAVDGLREGDVLLVAGKGHEDYQIIGTTKHPFSDHEVVADALRS
ncbi:MAG: UDP-N-acetylmuramoyl-L-alanyl-D-glutamate--2,6-diaminopimelate ligase [Hyphomicrobiaceae bacterium]|nr:UDP-N-acetylmuramoyl-L-alanyl-D-glutamate--2,6-diaminopimelate ligase [Hyphomicrobiaceae bacterium]